MMKLNQLLSLTLLSCSLSVAAQASDIQTGPTCSSGSAPSCMDGSPHCSTGDRLPLCQTKLPGSDTYTTTLARCVNQVVLCDQIVPACGTTGITPTCDGPLGQGVAQCIDASQGESSQSKCMDINNPDADTGKLPTCRYITNIGSPMRPDCK